MNSWTPNMKFLILCFCRFTPFIPSVNVICLMRKMTNDTIKAQRTNKKQRYSISCWIKVGVWINRFSLIVSFEAIY